MSDDGVGNWRFFGISLFLSWVVGPLLMFALAWLFLADQPAYRTGVIIVGLARCIAMVLVWNDIALGDRERAAVLVVFNALFQVAAYSLLGYFYLTAAAGLARPRHAGLRGRDLGGRADGADLPRHPARRRLPDPPDRPRRRGRDWYEQRVHPADRAAHALRAAVHDRAAVRDPGRRDHRRSRSTSRGSRCRCSSTSRSCGSPASRSGRLMGFPYAADRGALLHRRLATTSSWRSPSPSASSAPRPARRSPASSAR